MEINYFFKVTLPLPFRVDIPSLSGMKNNPQNTVQQKECPYYQFQLPVAIFQTIPDLVAYYVSPFVGQEFRKGWTGQFVSEHPLGRLGWKGPLPRRFLYSHV